MITTNTIRRVHDSDDGVTLEIKPVEENKDYIEIYPADETSHDFFRAWHITLTKPFAKQLGLALITASEEN